MPEGPLMQECKTEQSKSSETALHHRTGTKVGFLLLNNKDAEVKCSGLD